MRIRRKPWARPELAACPYFYENAYAHRGIWHSLFPRKQPMHLELGIGKGAFIAQAAVAHPEINYMGVDIKSDIIGVARRRIEAEFAAAQRPVDNIVLAPFDITRMEKAMSETDYVERIYINFCNPWPTGSCHKKRLTHPRQLAHYRTILADGGDIYFKTDDDDLFENSLDYFRECRFEIIHCTRDLHAEPTPENYETEHERMFSEQGIPIKFCIARKLPDLPEAPSEAG